MSRTGRAKDTPPRAPRPAAIGWASRVLALAGMLLGLSLGPLACTVAAQEAILPIGTVQGRVGEADDGRAFRSPFAPRSGNAPGRTVTVQGVIYQLTLAHSPAGPLHGFFLQNTPATADGDPATSDGLFVALGRSPSLGGYTPRVGDEVVLRGRVAESFNQTQLQEASLVRLVRSGVNLDAEVPAFEADPPADLAEADRYWERREGMRARLPAGALVLDGRDVFPGTLDGELWVARADSPIARRADPYARRAFRDPHPLDNRADELFDDGNGYRLLLASHGLKATAGDSRVLIAPARAFDTLASALVGGVGYAFGKYAIHPQQQLALASGADPALNAPPRPPDRAVEYSLATYNLENLYDFRDDPFDGCDFAGNPGCPGVSPPFDYAPASEAEYQARLHELALQILADLHAPDILLVQEAEDQDICWVEAEALACGAEDDADGRPDSLQELALVVAALGGPTYDAAYDRDGADDRGIVSAYLYRAERVELLPARADHPVLGPSPRVSARSRPLPFNAQAQNPKALNVALPDDVERATGVDGDRVFTRAPQVAGFRVWREAVGVGDFVDLYVVNNHFSSGPDRRVGQRKEQASYLGAIVAALQADEPEARVLVGGDLNAFPRPDDPFPPGHRLHPSDQLGPLYDAGLANLYDALLAEAPASAYTYVFQGQAQTLDHLFASPALRAELVEVRVAHVNADWPSAYLEDGPRGASDHDPVVARFAFPEAPPRP